MQNQRINFALLQYYLREKLWRHALALSGDLAQALNDPVFRLWKAFTLDMEGNLNEGLREYRQCENRVECNIAALTSLEQIYRRSNDNDAAERTAQRIQAEEANAQPGAVLQAAILLWHSGDLHKARDVVNRVLERYPDYRDEYTSVQLVRGWIDLASGRGAYMDKANAMFEQVIASESAESLVDIDATMGRVLYLERKNQYWAAQELLNKLVVAHPNFVPALIVKAKQLMSVEDWDQASEVTSRILQKDSHNIEAIVLSILFYLVKEPRVSTSVQHVQELHKALSQREPRNAQLYYSYGQCIARLAGGNLQLLGLTTALVEQACQIQPNNTDYQAEVAYQVLLKGDQRTATQLYRKASSAGDGNIIPLLGTIKCTILQGKLQDAASQIDFLNQIQTTKNAELLLLNAMILWRKDRDQRGSLEKLDQAVEAHKQDVNAQQTGATLYVKLNPPFMLEVAREYTQHCRTEPASGPNQKQDPLLEKTRRVLDLLLRHMPGCTEAQLLSSKLSFVSGDIDRANNMIAACIRQDQSLSEAHLLSAQIHQYAGNLQAANQALDQALSQSFDMKDQPQYLVLKGMVLCSLGEFLEARMVLEHALKLTEDPSSTRSTRPVQPLSVQDHVSLYLQLAQVYLRLKDTEKARSTIADATKTFRETSQMGRITIAQAMLVARTDVDQALEVLRTVPAGSEFFLTAKAQMAQLYLTQKQNRRMFAKCYEELVEAFPTAQSFIHLGEAYASIQDPEKAIVAFEKARAIDPNDAELAVRIGRTLVTTHDYHRALRYYRDAVASDPHRSNLRQDLATLCWRLDKIDMAIQVLKESPVLAKAAAHDDLLKAAERVSLHLMMFRIYRATGDGQAASEALIQARVFQNSVIQKAKNEGGDIRLQQAHIASSINFQLGEYYVSQQLPDKALPFYVEALKHEQTNDNAMLALARLYLRKGDLSDCEKYCNELLQVNPSCEEALMMLADLMFRKNQYEDAAYNFLQLLEKKPRNYSAMVQYVLLLRRAGHLQEAPAVFKAAEALMKPGAKPDPGLCYAKGLYYRYTNQSREALKEFNSGRVPKDGPWAQKCLVAMVETYILPDNENLWSDTNERSGESAEPLRIADSLIHEIKDDTKRLLLDGYCNLAWKRKDTIERANARFYELLEKVDKDGGAASSKDGGDGGEGVSDNIYVPAFVGIAIGLQLSKQTSKARGNLKRMSKGSANYNPDEDDDYERGWLLLADLYIQQGKYDLAQDLLNRAIKANKSCCRAWELLGLIFEKEQSYKDAADCYENAWKLVNESEAAIGYKLAFNYMKARKFVQAIDVSKVVLAKHPDYPKIKKDVLERSRNSLRP